MSVADPLTIAQVQLVRKAALLAGILILIGLAAVADSGPATAIWSIALLSFSILAIVVAIVGRAWCSLYIGGRKKAEIVDRGPYSLTRNPLYLFSFIGAIGIGAQSGSVVLTGLVLLTAILVFSLTVRREEQWLGTAFGLEYADYRARTPRFWPDFSSWRDTESLIVHPAFFLRTLRDGCVMLLAIPLFAAVRALHHANLLPTFFFMP